MECEEYDKKKGVVMLYQNSLNTGTISRDIQLPKSYFTLSFCKNKQVYWKVFVV